MAPTPWVPTIKVRQLPSGHDLPVPRYATPGAAGMDLHSAIETVIRPGERELIFTGIAIELPRGYEAQIRPRSGLAANKGVTVLNAPGTIDSDYRGEVGVLLINHGKVAHTIKRGDRIAQMVIAPVAWAEIETTLELTATERGEGGFGSTGTGG